MDSRILILLVLFACGPRPQEPPPLEVEFGPCAFVTGSRTEPTCGLHTERLVLWVKSDPDARIEIETGDRSLGASDGTLIEDGYRFVLPEPEAAILIVRAVRGTHETRRVLPLEVPKPRADPAYLEEENHPLEAGILLSKKSRITAKQDVHQALEEVGRALELHRHAGNSWLEVYDLTFFYEKYYDLGDLEAARAVLFEDMPKVPLAAGDGTTKFQIAFHRGRWAVDTGDARMALVELDAAVRQAERLDQVVYRNMAQQVLAHQLRRLGRHAVANEIWDTIVNEIGRLRNDCEKAVLLNNFAWDRLLMLEARLPAPSPIPELERALEWVPACPNPEEKVNLQVNLALAHIHDGKPELARQQLDDVRAVQDLGRWLLVWIHDVEGRIALAEGKPADALESYDALTALAPEPKPGVAWRAAVGRARALVALGNTEEAMTALARAEDLIDEESRQAPIDAGSSTSVTARQWGTELYLDLLLRAGRVEAALQVARRARSRFFRSLARDARRLGLDPDSAREWSLLVSRYKLLRDRLEAAEAADLTRPSKHAPVLAETRKAERRELDQLLGEALALIGENGKDSQIALPPLRRGELLLVYHPAPDGWFAFAADSDGVDFERTGAFEPSSVLPAEQVRHLLAPFAERIREAERVRVLPYGALREVDFHALPFGDDVLLAVKPVLYGLDLPPSVPGKGKRALLVADPSGSLSNAPGEIAEVKKNFERQGWNVEVLRHHAEPLAAAEDVRGRLDEVELLHFAGHADFVGRAWDSGLLFDRDGVVRLSVGDILTSPAVPAVVVLSACETAQTATLEAPVALGVSHAFLVAGGRVALGAARPVDDYVTTKLVRYMYTAWRDCDFGPECMATALAAAQLRLRTEDPGADWASFRVLER